MTRVYFVRHAQPEHDWEDDRTRPLTEEGKKDSAIVLGFLKDKKIDAFYCSCLLYTSPSPRDGLLSRMPSSA